MSDISVIFKEDTAGPRDPRSVDWAKTDYELFKEHLHELNDELFEDEPQLRNLSIPVDPNYITEKHS